MAGFFASIRQLSRVIVSPSSRGRLLALHRHRKRRVRRKYNGALVVMRESLTPEKAPRLLAVLQEMSSSGVRFSPKAARRVARALCSAGTPARAV